MAVIPSAEATGVAAVARALADSGITCLEATVSTSGALDAPAAVSGGLGLEVVIDPGTVLTTGRAREPLAAGTEFLVAPAVGIGVTRGSAGRGIPFRPGTVLTTGQAREPLTAGTEFLVAPA